MSSDEEARVGETEAVVRLVLGVARLGESDLFGWWRSRGLGEAGRYVLGGWLPRTWQRAALEGDVLSAAAGHEEVFARRDALHLFSDELAAKTLALAWLRERKGEGDADGLLAELRSWARDTAAPSLLAWAGVEAPRGEVLGEGRCLGALAATDLDGREGVLYATSRLAAAWSCSAR
ncbi:MAG: BrxE family protein [Thermoleophilia bacterium]